MMQCLLQGKEREKHAKVVFEIVGVSNHAYLKFRRYFIVVEAIPRYHKIGVSESCFTYMHPHNTSHRRGMF